MATARRKTRRSSARPAVTRLATAGGCPPRRSTSLAGTPVRNRHLSSRLCRLLPRTRSHRERGLPKRAVGTQRKQSRSNQVNPTRPARSTTVTMIVPPGGAQCHRVDRPSRKLPLRSSPTDTLHPLVQHLPPSHAPGLAARVTDIPHGIHHTTVTGTHDHHPTTRTANPQDEVAHGTALTAAGATRTAHGLLMLR